MLFDEQSLRDLLTSPYGRSVAFSLVERFQLGEELAIETQDGRKIIPASLDEVRDLMASYGLSEPPEA